jgi:hypothetical protein
VAGLGSIILAAPPILLGVVATATGLKNFLFNFEPEFYLESLIPFCI